jgi:hypothetical protein
MDKSIQERTGYSSQEEGQYRVITSMEIAADEPGSDLPAEYRPCKVTWAEFKGDVQSFFSKMRSERIDRIDNIREGFNSVFHRNKHVEPTRR